MSAESSEIREFYDDYVERQGAVGINDRHRAIMSWLEQAGMEPGQRVLEIGCGIGTLTQLLVEAVGARGHVTAVDISPRSVETARQRIGASPNLELVAADVVETVLPGRFDVVVLPDVIEHIPLEQHPALFGRVAAWLDGSGFALMNYPSPHYLAWCHVHRPDLLQVVDQPIHADALTANAYPHGLYLDFLKTYSIWIEEGDYVIAVMRPTSAANTFTTVPERPPSLARRVARRLRGSAR
jgi:trans-aconitate 2-methyltransferase